MLSRSVVLAEWDLPSLFGFLRTWTAQNFGGTLISQECNYGKVQQKKPNPMKEAPFRRHGRKPEHGGRFVLAA